MERDDPFDGDFRSATGVGRSLIRIGRLMIRRRIAAIGITSLPALRYYRRAGPASLAYRLPLRPGWTIR